MRTAVVIPTYNEEDSILCVLEKARGLADIVYVVDSSDDRTPELVRESGLAVLLTAVKRGKGAQLREGFSRSLSEGADFIVQMDGDGERDPKDIRGMVEKLMSGDSDIIVGRRRAFRSLRRTILNSFGLFWIRLITGRRVSDPFSGMIAYRRKALESLCLRTDGFEIEPEIMLESQKAGLSVEEREISSPSFSGTKFRIRDMVLVNYYFDRWVLSNPGFSFMRSPFLIIFCLLGLLLSAPLAAYAKNQ